MVKCSKGWRAFFGGFYEMSCLNGWKFDGNLCCNADAFPNKSYTSPTRTP